MISKNLFVTIMDGFRDYWDAYSKFEDALGVQIEQNFLTDIFDTVMNALVEELEIDIDNDIGPLIYYYAFECDFGRDTTEKDVMFYTAAELYDYLMGRGDSSV